MTYAPPCVKAARSFLLTRGWPAASVGIIGDPDHRESGGYHCGNDWLSAVGRLTSDYSKRESARDRPGSDAAMALDIGGVGGIELARISKWLVAQCVAGAADAANIREIIYYDPSANAVRRWDRLGIRSTGDSSHRYHTHISYFRSTEGQDKAGLFRRYYEGEADTAVALTPEEWRNVRNPNEILWQVVNGAPVIRGVQLPADKFVDVDNKPQKQADRIEAAVQALLARPVAAPVAVDAAAVAAALAGNAEFLRALAVAVADEDHRRSAS